MAENSRRRKEKTLSTIILLCEPAPEIEQILRPHKETLQCVTLTTTQKDAVPLLIEEHDAKIVLLNCRDPKHICHRLKMDPSFYSVPVFVFLESGAEDFELQFLANEVFQKPFSEAAVISNIKKYLNKYDLEHDSPLQTITKNTWIEEKVHDTYFFEFIGTIEQYHIEKLLERINELLTVGRRTFTIKLVHASHADNIPSELFSRLHNTVQHVSGHIKFLVPQSSFADNLNNLGLDVDQYLPGALLDSFNTPDTFPHPTD